MRFRHCLVALPLLALSSATASLLPYQSRTAPLLPLPPDNFVGLRPYEQNYLMETFSNKITTTRKICPMMRSNSRSVLLAVMERILGVKICTQPVHIPSVRGFQFSNRGESSPFRESNYQPQLFVAWATDYDLPFGWNSGC